MKTKFLRGSRWLACALFVIAGGASGNTMKIRVLAQESIPPKWILGGDAPRGLCPDLFAAIERVDPRLHFTGYDRGRSLPVIEDALDSGRVDAACALLDSPRRRSVAIRSSVPVYQVRPPLAAVASDTQVVNNLDDLVRLHPLINTARGSGFILELKSRGIQVDDSTGDNIVNLRKILHGHGRYTYMNELSLAYLIRTEHLQDKVRMLAGRLQRGAGVFLGQPQG